MRVAFQQQLVLYFEVYMDYTIVNQDLFITLSTWGFKCIPSGIATPCEISHCWTIHPTFFNNIFFVAICFWKSTKCTSC